MDLYRDNFQRRSRLLFPTSNSQLGQEEITSLVYHDIFDYPLTFSELIKWRAGGKLAISLPAQAGHQPSAINHSSGFYFLEGKGAVVYKRLLRKRISIKKLEIAKRAAKILSLIPTIRMVGVTGALSMENSSEDSDIDLIIVTQQGTLWTTRLATLFFLKLLKIPVRRAGERQEKDKLCLNMWLDEEELTWRRGRNAYSAHEIAQILPLVNKGETYEKFIWKNRWITEFWPNSVKLTKRLSNKAIKEKVFNLINLISQSLLKLLENTAYQVQYLYMRKKITKEVVTPTRALFHPIDWGKVVLGRLENS